MASITTTMVNTSPSFPSRAGLSDAFGSSTFVGGASSAPAARGGAGLQHRLASLVQQLSGLQQHSLDAGAGIAALQATACPMQAASTTATKAGAVLRSLSTGNPRVLALAAAAAKAPYGTPEHAAVLSALKDEIVQASAGNSAAAGSVTDVAPDTYNMEASPEAQAVAAAAAGNPNQQQLTQDALWAALMAKAAARTGDSNPSSPHNRSHKQAHQQQLSSPQALPGHASSDSTAEAAEGTSCALPWALLQAAQQAQEAEEEKEAAAAAAAGAKAAAAAPAASPVASDAEAAAAETRVAAASTPSPMAVDTAEAALESPSRGKGSTLVRSNSTVLFKRRHVNNSNVLQRHFSKPAALQPAAAPLARTQSEAATVPKPQHTFKKQLRRKPLVLRGGSSSNLALAQQLGQQQQQQQQSAAVSMGPECSAETGVTGPQYAAPADTCAPTLSNVSLRAPAATAPAAVGGPGLSDVMGFLACREKQLQVLQEQLQLQRRRMTPTAGEPAWPAMSGLSGYLSGSTPIASTAAGPCSLAQSTQAISELQRLLSSMAAAAGPNSAAAAAAAAAGVAPALPLTADTADTDMQDLGMHYEAGAAAGAALLAQAKFRLSQQQQAQQQQYRQEDLHASTAQPHALSTIKALAAALSAAQQRQQQQQPIQPAAATWYAGGGHSTDLLRQLAAALQANK